MAKKETGGVVDTATYEYGSTKIRDKDGKVRTSRGNGDAVANAMLLFLSGGGDIDQVIRANKLEDKMKPHAKKQPGLRRMTLGVMLRALVRNDTPVKIGKITVEKLTQKVEMPKVEKAERPARKVPVKAQRVAAAKKATKGRRAAKKAAAAA